MLRVANALPLTPSTPGTRLRNVHVGIPPSGVTGGTLHLVEGVYDYYHYLQDRVDDSGWGCAYRSLQTLCSWFQRQGYTTKAPPSHRDIQTTLVKIGRCKMCTREDIQWANEYMCSCTVCFRCPSYLQNATRV